jgi:hypothetical protein
MDAISAEFRRRVIIDADDFALNFVIFNHAADGSGHVNSRPGERDVIARDSQAGFDRRDSDTGRRTVDRVVCDERVDVAVEQDTDRRTNNRAVVNSRPVRAIELQSRAADSARCDFQSVAASRDYANGQIDAGDRHIVCAVERQ